jgi:hypothetical protein
MQKHLKTLSKNFCLFAFSCMLLVSGLFGLQQHTSIAHAALLHTARTTMPEQPQNCKPPKCNPFPFHDIYLFTDSAVWGRNGTSSDLIDDNQIGLTNGNQVSSQFGPVSAVLARGNNVYEWRRKLVGEQFQKFLFAIAYGGCTTSTGYCLTELDDNPHTFLAAAGTVGFYQAHSDGSVWQLTGRCYHCWKQIDNHPSHDLVASSHLYETRTDGTVWRYNGTPFNWTEVDNNPMSTDLSLAIDTHNVLYELTQVLSNGQLVSSSVLKGYGPFNFQPIDTVHLTGRIVADSRLYQWSDAGILIYQGGTSWGVASLPPSSTRDVEAGAASDAVYWELSDHSVWQFTPQGGTVEISIPAPALQMSRPLWVFYSL